MARSGGEIKGILIQTMDADGIEDHAKEFEHSSLQEKLDKELKE
ncbi:kinesin-like protein KIN-4C [Senna tora]|uniref:Kinesin-like protein KIN-4C n=1 Tax=Senna tora TaxID=362788 RepID=A0A834XAC4_9FABA|nr:kinesin-like protein KIN-4C [Senna tora]